MVQGSREEVLVTTGRPMAWKKRKKKTEKEKENRKRKQKKKKSKGVVAEHGYGGTCACMP